MEEVLAAVFDYLVVLQGPNGVSKKVCNSSRMRRIRQPARCDVTTRMQMEAADLHPTCAFCVLKHLLRSLTLSS